MHLRWLDRHLRGMDLNAIINRKVFDGLFEAKRIAWIHLDQVKARKAIGIPLDADADSRSRDLPDKTPSGKEAVQWPFPNS